MRYRLLAGLLAIGSQGHAAPQADLRDCFLKANFGVACKTPEMAAAAYQATALNRGTATSAQVTASFRRHGCRVVLSSPGHRPQMFAATLSDVMVFDTPSGRARIRPVYIGASRETEYISDRYFLGTCYPLEPGQR